VDFGSLLGWRSPRFAWPFASGRFAAVAGVIVSLTAACGGKVLGSSPPVASDASVADVASSRGACSSLVATSEGPFWALEEIAATLSVTCARAAPYVSVVAAGDLDADCLEPGPAYASRSEMTYEVHLFAWRHRGVACSALSSRRTFLRPLRLEVVLGATNRFKNSLSASELDLAVAKSPAGCSRADAVGFGASCSSDCDCVVGSECVPDDVAGCSGKCLQPCGENLDCQSGICVLHPDAMLSVCERGDCRQSGNLQCPKGTTCLCSSPPDSCLCHWNDRKLPPRQTCASDEDCPTPTECVEGGPCGRECGIRCTTSGMLCPLGSLCPDVLRVDRPWTCEVIE